MTFERLEEKTPVERRRWPRIEAKGQCSIEETGEACTITNIGPGGIRISSKVQFEPGNKYKLKVALQADFYFETLAYVVWCLESAEGEGGSYEVGFKFVDLPSEDFDRLKDFVYLNL